MYRVLVVDDQQYKLENIASQINRKNVILDLAKTLCEGKTKINSYKYDLILLDISLKSLTMCNEFEGLDILTCLEEKELETPVIAITQFYNFNDFSLSSAQTGYSAINIYYKKNIEYTLPVTLDVHILPNLHEYLSQNYKNYYGCVLYSQNDTIWVSELKKMLFTLGGNIYEDFIIR